MGNEAAATAGAHDARFSGWSVIAGLFGTLMISSGLGFYGQAVYLRALVDEHDWSTGLTSAATATFFVVSGLAGYAVSGVMGRVDVRRVIAVGLVLGAVGQFLLGRVTQPWQMFGADVVFGVGFALAGLVPATTTVARWFVRRRSVALSIASTGLSAGGIAITPLVGSLVKRHGLGEVSPWLALTWVAVGLPLTFLLVRSSPADKGQHPDGDTPVAPVGQAAAVPGAPVASVPPAGFTFGQARATRFYRLLTVAYLFLMLGQVGGISQQVKLVDERVSSLASLSVTLVAAASVVGRLAGGLIVSRVSPKAFTMALVVVQAAALASFAFASTTVSIVVTCLTFGLSVGNLLMLQPLLLAEAYGVREYSRIYSMSSLVMTLGVGAGPTVFGILHDVSSYELSFLAGAAASVAGFGLLALAGPLVPYEARAHDDGERASSTQSAGDAAPIV